MILYIDITPSDILMFLVNESNNIDKLTSFVTLKISYMPPSII